MKQIRPYIIAEISTNHAKDIEVAKSLIEVTAEAGATSVKLQTFTAELMTVPSRLIKNQIPSSSTLWSGLDLFDLMREAETPLGWHSELFTLAKSLGLDAFSTPYHPSSVEFLLNLGVTAFKVSSFDVINHPLLKEIALSNLPVIMSVGMATLEEIDDAVVILNRGVKSLVLLKCTSSYPCTLQDANLSGISHLKERFGVEVGFSDHTIGNLAAMVAVGAGATVFEKHLKSREGGITLDSEFSIDSKDFPEYVASIKNAYVALGTRSLGLVDSEKASHWERPSLVALREIPIGEVFDDSNVGVRRPSLGLPPKRLFDVQGKKCARRLLQGEGVTEESVVW